MQAQYLKIVAEVRQALEAGDWQHARLLLMPLTQTMPHSGQVWHLLAEATDDPRLQEDYLTRARARGYNSPLVYRSTQTPVEPVAPTRTAPPARAAAAPTARPGWSSRQVVGMLGATLLAISVFLPLFSFPIIGPITLFGNGSGIGQLIVGMAVVAAVLVALRRHLFAAAIGAGTLVYLGYTYISFRAGLGRAETELAGSPFAPLARTLQLQWGWAVMSVGAILLVVGALMRDRRS